MRTIARLYRVCIDACAILTGLIVVGIAFGVTAEVFSRNAFGHTFPWLLEGSEYAFYVAVFAAIPWCLHQGAHVRVDVLLLITGPALGRRIEIAADTVGVAVAGVLTYCGISATVESIQTNTIIYKSVVFPEWMILAVFPFSMFLLTMEFVFRLLSAWQDDHPAPMTTTWS